MTEVIAKEPVNILLVDDQPGKLLSYEAILDELGENLIKANSGREALDHLLKTDITVVLMDVSMPELDGFELAEIIRQHPRYQKTAIIFVSAVHLSDLDRLKGYKSGAVDYVSVPVVPELLRAKVSVFTELYRKTRDADRLNRELEYRVAERTAELEESMRRQMALTEQLRETDRRKDEFLALLAHELRNPLAPVVNALGIMQKKPDLDPDLRWCRDVIERQTRQLARLVDDLLDVSRITLGKVRLRMEKVNLAETVQRAAEISSPIVEAHGHELRITLPDEPLFVDGDMTRLTQVIANLLNNAAKYQEAGGSIALSVKRNGDTAVISVTDQGVGIPAEMLSQIFELFAQGARSLDREEGGLGVGLSVVKTVVDMHGGRAFARSAGAGRGSEFVVELPCSEDSIAHGPAFASSPAADSESLRHRILVVDDSEDVVQSLAILLRMEGHEVLEAHDGPRALASIESHRPDVVLLDIGLPGMDGYEVCRRARAECRSDALFIAMTGYGQDRDRARSVDAGFDEHAVKPVEFDALLKLLERRVAVPASRAG